MSCVGEATTATRKAPRYRRFRAEALDWPLLHWLLRCPFLRVEDLAAFSGLTRSTTSRHLEDLERWGLVEWVAPACIRRRGAEKLYHLSNAGIHLLAAALGADASALARTWCSDERRLLNLLPQLPQLIRVQAVVGGIVAGAPRALGEKGREAHGVWHWVRNYTHRFSSRERAHTLRADAALALHVTQIRYHDSRGDDVVRWERRDRWHAAFIVADTRLQDWDAAARLLDTLLAYRESPERWPHYAAFPPVLILAEHQRHAEHWQRIGGEIAQARHLPPLAGAVAVVPRPPSLVGEGESIDPWRLPWQLLTSGTPVRLATLLAPMPRAAVPPGFDGLGAPAPVVSRGRTVVVPHPGPRVIVGSYQRRAIGVAESERRLEGDSDSYRGARRSDLRLLSLRLNGRLVETLELLYRAPGIRVADLAALLGVRLTTVDRYLSELDRYGLLRQIEWDAADASAVISCFGEQIRRGEKDLAHLSYGPAAKLYLSVDGHRLVTLMQEIGVRSRLGRRAALAGKSGRAGAAGDSAAIVSTRDRSAHDAGVFHFFALLAHAAEEECRLHGMEEMCEMRGRSHGLVWWEVGALAERRYRYRGSWHNLRPDGAGLYQADRTRCQFWLEWDQGSMNLANLTRKFASYAVYLASGEWRETPDRIIPRLVVVVQSLGQLERMRRAALAVAADYPELIVGSATGGRLTAAITLASRLDEAGPLAPIWWPLLPDSSAQELSGAEPLADGGSPPNRSPGCIFPLLCR